MAEQIHDGWGTNNPLKVNADGSINTTTNISGVSFSGTIIVSDIEGTMYIVSGNALAGIGSNLITNFPNFYLGSEVWQKGLGSVYTINPSPTMNNSLYQFKYIYSGTSTGVIGSEIGSIVQFIGTGSYVRVLQYTDNVLTQVGSWT